MDYIQARLDLVRLGLQAFKSGESFRALVEGEGGDWPDLVRTIARSNEAETVVDTERKLKRLLGQAASGEAYVIKRVATRISDFIPQTQPIDQVEQDVMYDVPGELPDYAVYLVRARSLRRARQAVTRGTVYPLFRLHLIDPPQDADPKGRELTELVAMDSACHSLIDWAGQAQVQRSDFERATRQVLELTNRLQGNLFSGYQSVRLLPTQVHIEGTRLLVEAFKTGTPLRELIEQQGYDLHEFMRLWVGSKDAQECERDLEAMRVLCAEGMSGAPYLLKFITFGRELPASDGWERLSDETIGDIKVNIVSTIACDGQGVHYCLTRANSAEGALENALSRRSSLIFSLGLRPDQQPEWTRERDDLYCEVVRDVGTDADRWQLERQIARTFGVYNVDCVFSPFD